MMTNDDAVECSFHLLLSDEIQFQTAHPHQSDGEEMAMLSIINKNLKYQVNYFLLSSSSLFSSVERGPCGFGVSNGSFYQSVKVKPQE